MNSSIVKVQHLSHRYAIQWAIKDINFELSRGGVYGLLGANGAGKSTIMNILCGVLRASHGDVFIRGVNIRKQPLEAKRFIGFLPQHPPVLGDLTVEEYLRHSAHIRLMPADSVKDATNEVMEKVAVTHFRKRLIKNLSGGFQQRVGIAQAIIHKPDLVVFDEPTNGLDPNQILEVRKLIKEIAEDRTVLLSTHILQEVQALCDHVWMVNEGRFVFAGSMQEFDNQIQPSSIIISLMNPPSLQRIASLEGVVKVEQLAPQRFRLLFNDPTRVMDAVVSQSNTQGWRLTELQMEKNSLENIFASLSGKTIEQEGATNS